MAASLGLAGNPLVEPHLVAHPSDAGQLLGAVIVMAEAEREERLQRQRCVSFEEDPWGRAVPEGYSSMV